MFFSVIIPTYNPRRFLPRLLDSISHNKCINEIEIIISDDCSTEEFDDIIEQYDSLNIRKISNEKHMGFPRAGRQHGVDEATGEWINFADQDDYFLNGAFDRVKETIISNKVSAVLISNFIVENSETYEQRIENAMKGWTHGKFYNRKFLLDNDIRYDEIDYCEDINLSTKISCVLIAKDIQYIILEDPIYVWCKRRDSLSEGEYFVNSFPNYIQATLGIVYNYLEKYITNVELAEQYNILFIQTFLHMYFYLQSDFFFDRNKYMKVIEILQPIYAKYKTLTGYTNESFVQLLSTDLLDLYNNMRFGDVSQIPFIEQITFKDWINIFFT